jgi:hypothetical protein
MDFKKPLRKCTWLRLAQAAAQGAAAPAALAAAQVAAYSLQQNNYVIFVIAIIYYAEIQICRTHPRRRPRCL